jgi:hypothetical protein
MSMPGFISEDGTLFASPTGARVIPALLPQGAPGAIGCLSDCIDTCTSGGASARACATKCNSYCHPRGGGSGDGPTGIDRTNCDLCKASNLVWLAGCEADYHYLSDFVLISVFGPLAGGLGAVVNALISLGLGSDACRYVYNQSVKQCPC